MPAKALDLVQYPRVFHRFHSPYKLWRLMNRPRRKSGKETAGSNGIDDDRRQGGPDPICQQTARGFIRLQEE